MLTIQEHFGALQGLSWPISATATTCATSLILLGAAMGVSVTVCVAPGIQPHRDIVTQASWLAAASGREDHDYRRSLRQRSGRRRGLHRRPRQHGHGRQRRAGGRPRPYKVTTEHHGGGQTTAVFMHGLPMHRGEEVDAAWRTASQSIIFDQREPAARPESAADAHAVWNARQLVRTDVTAAMPRHSDHESDLATMLLASPGGAATDSLAGRSVLSDLDLSASEMAGLIETALWLKALREAGAPHPLLFGKTLGIIFQHRARGRATPSNLGWSNSAGTPPFSASMICS